MQNYSVSQHQHMTAVSETAVYDVMMFHARIIHIDNYSQQHVTPARLCILCIHIMYFSTLTDDTQTVVNRSPDSRRLIWCLSQNISQSYC